MAPVVALATQCAEGVQFNWVCYLYIEFLSNYREAYDLSKTFHYAWLLLSILLVAGDLPVMESWPQMWHALDLAEMEKIAAQQRKKDTKLCIV